jgi:PAS domain S-box-containing protein
MFDTALDAILVVDDQDRYIDANPSVCALTGYSREELLQRSIYDLTPSENRQVLEEERAEFLEAGSLESEYTLLRKDGTTVEVEFRAVSNFLPGLHLAILHDITERRRAEEILSQENNTREAEAAVRLRIAEMGKISPNASRQIRK